MREVFHNKEDKVRIFEPPKELDKDLQQLVLFHNFISNVQLHMSSFNRKLLDKAVATLPWPLKTPPKLPASNVVHAILQAPVSYEWLSRLSDLYCR